MEKLGKICVEWKNKYPNYDELPENKKQKAFDELAKEIWPNAKEIPENEVRDFVYGHTGIKL